MSFMTQSQAKAINGTFLCKKDLYDYLQGHMQLFLPKFNRCPLAFLQGILKEDKKVFQRQQVATMFVPLWPELGIKKVWPQAMRIADMANYIPNEWTASDRTERRYFYGVLCTLAPQFVQSIVNEARQLRHIHRQEMAVPPRQMMISARWAEALLQEPFTSQARTTNRSLLIQAGPIQHRIVARRPHPTFVTTTDISNFIDSSRIHDQDDGLVSQQHQSDQAVAEQSAVIQARSEIKNEQELDPREERSQPISAPRNRHGNLGDRGDRALEQVDSQHPGLADDQITQRSQSISMIDGDNRAGGVLELGVDLADSFNDVGSDNGMLSHNSQFEEMKQGEMGYHNSNVHMSGQTHRQALQLAGLSRAQRLRGVTLVHRIDAVQSSAVSVQEPANPDDPFII